MMPLTLKNVQTNLPNCSKINLTRFEIRKPRWDPHPEKSKTNNHEWRQGLFGIFDEEKYDWMPKDVDIGEIVIWSNRGSTIYIIFENKRYNQIYYWSPDSYEVQELLSKKDEVEKLNQELARNNLFR